MAEFWNSLMTEKSWNLLAKLSKEPFNFILIGGWAAYMWTKLHKSKDIDIALTSIKEIEYLKSNYNLKKNDRLKKYEISFDEIDVDIYVPYFSSLSMPVEELSANSTRIEGLTVVKPEALLILKQGAELARRESVKGLKDQIDIMTLLCLADVNLKIYSSLLKKYKLQHYFRSLKKTVNNFKDHKYLDLDPRAFKLRKKAILKQLEQAQ